MAQETQKPTQNKDFDFILNQKSTEDSVKKGPDKKVIAIFVLIVVTLLVMGISFIVGSNKNVKPTNSSAGQHTDTSGNHVLDRFVALGSQSQFDQIYDELFDESTIVTKQVYDNEGVPLFLKLDIKSCIIGEEIDTAIDSEKKTTLTCKLKDSEEAINIVFLLKRNQNSDKVIYYNFMVTGQ